MRVSLVTIRVMTQEITRSPPGHLWSHSDVTRCQQLTRCIPPCLPTISWYKWSTPSISRYLILRTWNKTMWRLSSQNLTIATFSPVFTQLSIFILLFWLPSAQWGTFLHEWSLIWIPGSCSWLLRLWALIKHKQDHFIPATARNVTCLILKSPKWLLSIILRDKVEHCSRNLEEVRAYHSLSSRIWIKYEYFDSGSRKDGWFG